MGTSVYVGRKKIFDGKSFMYRLQFTKKQYADNHAAALKKKGHKVRIVKGVHPGYGKEHRITVYRVYSRGRR